MASTEPISFPRWAAPVLCFIMVASLTMLKDTHDDNIAMKKDIDHIQKDLAATKERQAQIIDDIAEMKASSSDFHDQALKGINELVERDRKRAWRK